MMMLASPETKTRGTNTTMFVRVEAVTAVVTSPAPRIAASRGAMPESCFLKITSRTTMELSTNIPTPRVRPARDMMFMSIRAKSIREKVAITDTGMAREMMRMERKFLRNSTRTRTARRPPCHAASVSPERDSRMDTDWSVRMTISTDGGRPAFMPERAAFTRRITSTVLWPCIFCTSTSTPGEAPARENSSCGR